MKREPRRRKIRPDMMQNSGTKKRIKNWEGKKRGERKTRKQKTGWRRRDERETKTESGK